MHHTYKKEPGIYIFTNKTNGKVYVGETMNIKKRISYYKYYLNCRPIENAILKYGIENFQIEVEYFPDFSKNDLLDLEEELIKRFNCLVPNGYNVCIKGLDTTGFKHSEESKKKMSNSSKGRVPANKGVPMKQEQKDLISKSKTGATYKLQGEDHPASKLSNKEVLEIRSLYNDGHKQNFISKLYRIGQDEVSRIVNYKRFKNIQ